MLLQCSFFITAIVQIMGVASVAPFIALVANPDLIHSNAISQKVYEMAGFASDRDFLVGFAGLLMLNIVVTNIIQAYSMWITVNFAKRLGIELQRDIFHGYIHRDYVKFSRLNSASLVATVSFSINRFVYMVVTPLLALVSNAIVVVLIVAGLMWYRPHVGIIGGLVVGSAYYAVFHLVKSRLGAHGRVIGEAAHTKHRMLNECLGGIKEIKLFAIEHVYEERLNQLSRASLRSETIVIMLGDLPRFLLEAIAFCALLALGIVLLLRNETPSSIVGTLSLYAMAGYRLLPAAQSVFKTASQIRANADVVDELKPYVESGRDRAESEPLDLYTSPMEVGNIEWHDVRYIYPQTTVPVLKGISFTIPQNSITVFVGTSGAGKSTMADLLLGLLTPTSGSITVGGQAINKNMKVWQRNVGYVPQNIFLLDDTISANISFGSASPTDMEKIKRAAELAQLNDFIQTLPGTYDYVVGERGALLSGGQRQRIGIARALYRDANVIVMDEATSALDSVTERDIIETLEKLKTTKTIVMIAHRLSTIKCADLVVLVADGTLVGAGSYDVLRSQSPIFQEIVDAGMEETQIM